MAKDAVDSIDDLDFDDNFEATRYGKEKKHVETMSVAEVPAVELHMHRYVFF